MQNKNKIKPKIDQNWPLTSCIPKISIFGNKPSGRVWGAFSAPKWATSASSKGAEFFFKFLGLSLLSTRCHWTSCKKSEKSNVWIFRYMGFFGWSLNYWSVFCTYFEDKDLGNQKFSGNGFYNFLLHLMRSFD